MFDRRSTRLASAAVLVLVAFVMLQGSAAAQGRGALRECFGPGPLSIEESQMSCQRVGGGDWQPVGGPSDPSDASGWFGMFLVIGLLLCLLPAFTGWMIAPEAGISPGVGFVIGLVASWLGVVGIYLYGHSQKRGTPVISVGRAAPADAAPAERLRTLQELLDQGLITKEEYDTRRKATVESL
jgi:hypothetical protein